MKYSSNQSPVVHKTQKDWDFFDNKFTVGNIRKPYRSVPATGWQSLCGWQGGPLYADLSFVTRATSSYPHVIETFCSVELSIISHRAVTHTVCCQSNVPLSVV